MFGPDSGVSPQEPLLDVTLCDGVFEYPMTVFNDGTGKPRHVQLGACSNYELEGLMWQALEQGRQSFMMLSHNFELLNAARKRPDPIMVKRFARFCRFMADQRAHFALRGFHDLAAQPVAAQPAMLNSPVWKTAHRLAQQALRRRYG